MARIAQRLFSWDQVEPLSDLRRLKLVLDQLPDEVLVSTLERERGKGRDDYPIRGLWNSVLAGVVFQHGSVESLRRELCRNGQLRYVCGVGKVAPAWVYTRFLHTVMDHGQLIEAMFEGLVQDLMTELPGFGQRLALDAKAISSFAARAAKKSGRDGRRDTDADWGAKTYRGKRQDGTAWEQVVRWFGYKLHLVVDSTYELPVAFSVTRASAADITGGRALLERMARRQPQVLERAGVLSADKGYDSTDLTVWLWEEHQIRPVIDIRAAWKDGEESRLLPGQSNVVYDQQGTVSCFCPVSGVQRKMANGGFERERGTLKKLCPARHYGFACQGRAICPVASGLRVALDVDRRIFTPVDRSSPAWRRLYRRRTAVERVNSRLDVSFGFELHTIRGRRKMQFRCGLALCVMLAMALGYAREQRLDKIRSLVA